jgi:autotransporter-associated beta strand protein
LQARIQDYNSPLSGASGAAGQMDLSGGMVDIMVDQMYIGRSLPDSATLAAGGSGWNGSGGFIFERGTVNATNLNIAYKQGTNASSALVGSGPCFVTARSNAVLTVIQDITLGYRNGGQGDAVTAANVPFGQLNVNDSAVVNVGGNIMGYTNSLSSIQLAGGTINMTGGSNVFVGNLTGIGTIAGAGTVMVYSNLSPGGDLFAGFKTPYSSGAGTLNIAGNLIYSNSPGLGLITNPAITFNLGANNTTGSGINDLINVTNDLWLSDNPVTLTFGGPLVPGNDYTLVTYGGTLHGKFVLTAATLSQTRGVFNLDYSVNHQIRLHVTSWSPANLVWQMPFTGGATSNIVWDLSTSNWLNGANRDRFYQGDNVTFNDTAGNNWGSTNICPSGLLFPGSITITGTNYFNITNRNGQTLVGGNIAGNCSITINSTGTNTFATFSNAFTGALNVGGGVLKTLDVLNFQANSAQTFGANTGTMFINNGATYDFNGMSGTTAMGKPVQITGSGLVVNGVPLGVFTNSSSSSIVAGFLTTLGNDCYVNADRSDLGIGGGDVASGGAKPFSGLFNLNTHNFTKMGSKDFILRDVVAPGNGDIYVGSGGSLALVNSQLGGTGGNLIMSNNTILAFGSSSSFYTTNSNNSITKPITFYNSAINTPYLAPIVSSLSVPSATANINSAVTLLGNLTVTNLMETLAFNNPTLAGGGVVFNSTITEGAGGPYSLIKYGNGNLTLNGAAGYFGSTIINGGTLTVGSSGSLPNTAFILVGAGTTMDHSGAGTFTLQNNSVMDLEGSFVGDMTVNSNATLFGQTVTGSAVTPITGSLTLQAGANVALGGTNNTGQITVGGSLTLNGANFTWDCGPSFASSDGITVTNGLSLSGTNIFNINAIGGFSPNGTNVLIKYAAGQLVTNANTLLVASNNGARYVLQMVNPASTPGQLCVRVVTPSPLLTWVGDVASSPTNWDKVTTNWLQNGTNDLFFTSDLVRFDDTASNFVVNVSGPLGPMWMSMENVNSNYVFNGKGAITTSAISNVIGAGVTFSNLGNNFVTGIGIVLNTNTITFAQPNTNGTLVSDLYGNPGSTFNKDGTNNLTLTANGSGFSGTFNIKNGTLTAGTWAAGATNYLGTGPVVISPGASLDIKGNPVLSPSSITVQGAGFDGNGAINNRGGVITNALASVTMTGPTTFGALSNAWGISTNLAGGGFALTKTNASDVYIQTGSPADLGNVVIGQGRLILANQGTTLDGVDTLLNTNISIWSGAALGLMPTNAVRQSAIAYYTMDLGNRSLYISNNAAIEAMHEGVFGTNLIGGFVSIITNGTAIMRVASSQDLMFNGPISGSGSNIFSVLVTNSTSDPNSSSGSGGTVWLRATNTYFGNTLVSAGQLNVYNSNSIPNNTTLIVSNTFGAGGSPVVELGSNGIYNATKTLRLSTFNGNAGIQGDGTWLGPIFIQGTNGILSFNVRDRGSNGLYLAGPLTTTRAATSIPALAGSIQFHGVNTRIAGPLNISVTDPHTSITIGVLDGSAKQFNENFTTVELDSPNNWKTIQNFERGQLIVGANDAFGTNVAIAQLGTKAGMVDHRCIIDLNGNNQSFSYMNEANDQFTFSGPIIVYDTIGNSSSNLDSTLTYRGVGTNTWVFNLVDTLGTPLVAHKLNLSVTSGCLELFNTNTYTGPTTVANGALLVEVEAKTNSPIQANWYTNYGSLGATPVTVNGGGVFGGNGSVGGNVTVNSGGTLTPGDLYYWTNNTAYPAAFQNGLINKIGGPLTMSIGATLTLGPLSTAVFDVDNLNGTNDQVAGAGTVIVGGTFVINNLGVAPYTNTQAIPLFQGFTNISGTVPIINPPYPGNHLAWDTSTLLTDGMLRVGPLTTTPPSPVITSSVSGGNLTISWPADHAGWTLQTQTNALNVGLKTNASLWYDIPSTVNTTSYTIPLATTNPTVFYRLRY